MNSNEDSGYSRTARSGSEYILNITDLTSGYNFSGLLICQSTVWFGSSEAYGS